MWRCICKGLGLRNGRTSTCKGIMATPPHAKDSEKPHLHMQKAQKWSGPFACGGVAFSEHFACGGVSTLHVEVCIGVEDLCVLESKICGADWMC